MIKYFDVYKSTKGYYVKEDVCRDFGINSNEIKTIKDVIYYKVPEETITSIEETTKNEAIQYKRNELALFDLQITLTIKVLVDITNNKKYINQINANKLNVIGNVKVIDNISYVEITDRQINEIVESTKNDTIAYHITYEEVELEEERKPVNNLFLYYHDLSTDTIYITREILELIRKNGIEIETAPKVIDNRNCYSIKLEKLKEFEMKAIDYRGVEKIIRTDISSNTNNETDPIIPYDDSISTIKDEIDPVIPYDDKLSSIFDENSIASKIRYEVNKALKDFFIEKPFNFVSDPVMPYNDEISNVIDEDLIPYDDVLSKIVDEDLIPYNDALSKIVDEDLIPYDDRLSTIIDAKELEAIKKNVIAEFEKYIKEKLDKEDIIPYNDDISTVYDESVLANRIIYEIKRALKKSICKKAKPFVYDPVIPYNDSLSTIKENNIIIVYKDINTGKLYIPEEYAKSKNNMAIILNKKCYETSIEELETIYNKRILIIDVAIRPKKNIVITICNNNGDLFISNEILKQFNIVSKYSKMILVNKKIYTQIGNEELDKLEKLELDNTDITIEIKKIVKINK